MPKLKTHKGTAKRVNVTKSGKILRENAATHHKLAHQSERSKRAKGVESELSGQAAKTIRRALGM